MMASVQNHRRLPRIPLRLPIELTWRGDAWRAETEDVGPGGCLVLSPRALPSDGSLVLTLRNEERADALRVYGSVAWAAGARYGIAYAPARVGAHDPASWFQRRLQSWPRMAAAIGRVPQHLPNDAPLYALPVPRHILDLTEDESALLWQLENGTLVETILARSGLPEDRAARAMLGLFEKNVVTLTLGKASEAWRWRAALGDSGRPAATPPPPVNGGAAAAGRIPLAPPPAERVPPAARAAEPRPAAAVPEQASPAAVAPAAPRVPSTPALQASAAWKALDHQVKDPTLLRGVSPTRRCHDAQARLDEARAAAQCGRIDQAVALLRRALALAPRDPEISHMLGELAFKDRRLPRLAPQT